MTEYDRLQHNKWNSYSISGLMAAFFMLLVFFSCQKNAQSKGVLSPEEMVNVLSEIYITEEKVNRLGLTHDSSVKVYDYFRGKVFEKMGTTDSTFKRSMDYYMGRPQEIEKIYATLIDSLNLREQRLSIPNP